MQSKTIVSLVVLNILLLASLFFHNVFVSPAQAVGGGSGRASEYIQISGEVQGGNSGVVFTIDTRNDLLSAFTFDGKALEAMPPMDLGRILK